MLPKLFPIHLRGTGESFAANIGGRLFGTSFAWIATTIAAASFWPSDFSGTQMATPLPALTATFALGWVVAGFLPEPQFAIMKGHDSDDEDIEEEETTAQFSV